MKYQVQPTYVDIHKNLESKIILNKLCESESPNNTLTKL